MKKELFNSGWEFCKKPLGISLPAVLADNDFTPVELPHDFLIFNSEDLYETTEGWYRKVFSLSCPPGQCAFLRFEGVYMDTTIYINGKQVFEWKYGYSSFEFEITPYLRTGDNELVVRIVHQSPNSRWYSGAGIYRNVWLKTGDARHFDTDGIYTSIRRTDEAWQVLIDSSVILPENTDRSSLSIRHSITRADGTLVSGAVDCSLDAATVFCPYRNRDITVFANNQTLPVIAPLLWDLDTPNLYTLTSELLENDTVIDSETCRIGFRTAEFTPEEGFLLNGRKVRINGACEHHDLGCLGSAVNKTALRRQLTLLKEMGVNAIRTSHNMPAVELMELADEMGILIDSESFDMWERPKTAYDYARFFKEWCRRDVASWIRRDRNHTSVILWSIGNEIYDTHADAHGQEITRMLMEYVRENDPRCNAPSTIGSNYMPWENAQKCADIIKYAGYNYAERYYDEHHAKHPDWIIYGSETSSVVQSRGIYHFPYRQSILSDDDEQCSSLCNSSTSWGAKNVMACIADDRDTAYSAGQFIWTGFDYIGEPTPYHTKNSYFGQIDTAGFPKDSFYIFQAEWTDYKKAPMVHLFPYWDFNEGQPVDVLICSNAPRVELLLNGTSLGTRELDHLHGRDDLIAHWQIPYTPGVIRALAYDEYGNVIAEDAHISFGDAASLVLKTDKDTLYADGRDLIFLTISAEDASHKPVENANTRVNVSVSGAGRLLGLDNGDSTDFEQYKCTCRRLFSGKLLAIIGATRRAGDIQVNVSAKGLPTASLTLHAAPLSEEMCALEQAAGTLISENTMLHAVTPDGVICLPAGERVPETKPYDASKSSIPVRKLVLTTDKGLHFSPECRSMEVSAVRLPRNADASELIWRITTDTGIDSNLAAISVHENSATVTALGDGEFCVRCMTKNGTDKVRVISQLTFTATGLGSATLDPYQFISAGLYDVSIGTITNGNERGVATSRNDPDTTFGFTNVDFGDYGSDEITIPIFALSGDAYPIQIWSGIPGNPDCELLADVVYQKPSIWNVYQEETFRLRRRVKGINTICFTAHDKIHVKGFVFTAPDKAYAQLSSLDNNRIYGDTFTVEADAITGIGNNVSLEYDNMNFGETGFSKLLICGRTPLENNTIHIRFRGEDGEEVKQIAEFHHSDDYEVQEFTLAPVKGMQKVTFVFLPGCNFDFRYFRFVK